MSIIHLIILSIVQGITEFLPVSSSAHLILTPIVLGTNDQGVLIDVAAHVGTLLAVIIYFRKDVWQLVLGGIDLMFLRKSKRASLAFFIIVATVPALIAGAAVMFLVGHNFRHILVIACANIFFAILLGWADKKGKNHHSLETLNIRQVFIIGLSQIFAFIPGTSRSGVTMTAARWLGMERRESARFSMLLAIPVIAAAGLFAMLDLANMPGPDALFDALWVVVFSFVAALFSIHVLLKILATISFMPFVWYRLFLGFALIVYFFTSI